MLDILHNYETVKLSISSPDIVNALIFMVISSSFLARLRRYPDQFELLDRWQTDQLKGLSILFVIIGHFWWHVAQSKPVLVFSGEAVAFFFMLSGFGMTMSGHGKPQSLRRFFTRRITRVLVPYWLATIWLLGLDYAFLARTYSVMDLFLTAFGINITQETRHIDFVRWYITLLLLWYILFYFAISRLKNSAQIIFLWSCGIIIFLIDYFVTHLFWYQILSFPVGCTLAYYYNSCRNIFAKKYNVICLAAVLLFCCCLAHKVWILHLLIKAIPYPAVKLFNELNSITFCFCLIIFVSWLSLKKLYCDILQWVGTHSNELFLLHGAFLIKYNPIISSTGAIVVVVQFIVFLLFIFLFSHIFRKIVNRINATSK